DVARLHDPELVALARELDVPRNVLDRLELLRDARELGDDRRRERWIVGAIDGDLLRAVLADDGRPGFTGDRLLDDATVLGDAEHVRSRHAVDDGRSEADPRVDD